MYKESSIRTPLILGHKTYHDISRDVCAPIEGPAPRQWKIAFTIALIVALYGIGCLTYLVGTGVGVWGLNKTVDWAWDITNFVWWVG
ncbi:MAG: hydrogenase, partial [Flavobacteriales bacterium]|nr:hydrogenase [Flavobacteriales bacterium]